MGNRLQGHNYGYTEARKNLPEKPLWGKNMTGNLGRNHGPNSEQLAARPSLDTFFRNHIHRGSCTML